jgi:hypothetical protein
MSELQEGSSTLSRVEDEGSHTIVNMSSDLFASNLILGPLCLGSNLSLRPLGGVYKTYELMG